MARTLKFQADDKKPKNEYSREDGKEASKVETQSTKTEPAKTATETAEQKDIRERIAEVDKKTQVASNTQPSTTQTTSAGRTLPYTPSYEKTDNRATGQLKATNEQKNSRWVLGGEEGLFRKKADGTLEKFTGTEGQNPEDFNYSSAEELIYQNAPAHLQQKRLNQLDQFGKLQNNADIIVTANGRFKDTEGNVINPDNMSRAERVAYSKQAGLKGKGFLNNVFGIGRGKNLGKAMDDVKDFTRTYGKNMMQYGNTSNTTTPTVNTTTTQTQPVVDTPGTAITNAITNSEIRSDKGGYEYKQITSGGKSVIVYRKKGEGDDKWVMTNNADNDTFNNAKFGKSVDARQAYLQDWWSKQANPTETRSGSGSGRKIPYTSKAELAAQQEIAKLAVGLPKTETTNSSETKPFNIQTGEGDYKGAVTATSKLPKRVSQTEIPTTGFSNITGTLAGLGIAGSILGGKKSTGQTGRILGGINKTYDKAKDYIQSKINRKPNEFVSFGNPTQYLQSGQGKTVTPKTNTQTKTTQSGNSQPAQTTNNNITNIPVTTNPNTNTMLKYHRDKNTGFEMSAPNEVKYLNRNDFPNSKITSQSKTGYDSKRTIVEQPSNITITQPVVNQNVSTKGNSAVSKFIPKNESTMSMFLKNEKNNPKYKVNNKSKSNRSVTQNGKQIKKQGGLIYQKGGVTKALTKQGKEMLTDTAIGSVLDSQKSQREFDWLDGVSIAASFVPGLNVASSAFDASRNLYDEYQAGDLDSKDFIRNGLDFATNLVPGTKVAKKAYKFVRPLGKTTAKVTGSAIKGVFTNEQGGDFKPRQLFSNGGLVEKKVIKASGGYDNTEAFKPKKLNFGNQPTETKSLMGSQYNITTAKKSGDVGYVAPNTFGNTPNYVTLQSGNQNQKYVTPENDGTNTEQDIQPEKKSFGQKSGEWLANNGSVLRGGINFGMNMLMKPNEATLKRTVNIINPAIGLNETQKQNAINEIGKSTNQAIKQNQSTDLQSNIINSNLAQATKSKQLTDLNVLDSNKYQQSYDKFTEAKNNEAKERDAFDNNIALNAAQAKNLRQEQIKNSVNDFGNILHQQAVQNYQNRSENQAKRDEIGAITEQERITQEHSKGINDSLTILNKDLTASKQRITDLNTRNKQLQQTLSTNPNDTNAKQEYDNNIAQIALEEGNQDPTKGSYYQNWNKANETLKQKQYDAKMNRLKLAESRIGRGLFKFGGSLSLEEKKELASYNSNFKESKDAKRDKVKDLRKSLKESKKLAQELYKSSKEDRKEGTKLIMDFYKSIKNK